MTTYHVYEITSFGYGEILYKSIIKAWAEKYLDKLRLDNPKCSYVIQPIPTSTSKGLK